MPALPPVPGVIRLNIFWAYGQDTSMGTRLFLSYTGSAPTSSALTTWCGSVSSAANGNLIPLIGTTVTYEGCQAIDLASASGGVGADKTTHVGTRAGSTLPASSCALRNLTIARRYRGGKPREYWPFGIQADLQGPQTWLPASINAFALGLGNFVTSIFGTPPTGVTLGNLVNVSYYSGFTVVTNPISGRAKNVAKPRTTPLVDTVLTAVFNPKIGTQRRRISA